MLGFLLYLSKALAFVIALPILALGSCLLWDKHKRSTYYAERPILKAMHGDRAPGGHDVRIVEMDARAAILKALPEGTSRTDFKAAFETDGFGCAPPTRGWPASVGLICSIEENPGAIYFLEGSWTVIAEFDTGDRLADVQVQRGK